MGKNTFITGGTGFIGINLIKLLAEKGWNITALHRPSSDLSALKELPVNLAQGSVTNLSVLKQAISNDTEVVFHLAGDTNLWNKHNKRQTMINVQGTENVLAASLQKKVPVLIHTSSVAAWGDVSGRVTEQNRQLGKKSWINYERTKWAGERKALQGLGHGMKIVILNPTNVIGPHDKNNWGRLFTALRDHKLPFIADGCVSITHVESVVRAHLAAVTRGKSGERYILAGKHCMFPNFVACINSVSGANNMPVVIPTPLFRGYAQLSSTIASIRNQEPSLTPELAHLMTRKNVRYISQKAADELNYRVPPMQKSVEDCYRWLKSEHIL